MKLLYPTTTRKTFKYNNVYLVYKTFAILRIYEKDNPDSYTDVEIDLEDLNLCRKYNWYIHHDKDKPDHMKYVYGYCRKLHRVIMNPPADMVVDHIDRNPLNNRRSNLRVCSISDNNKNFTISKNNTSGVVGVRYKPDKRKWLAYRTIDLKWFGKTFATKEEAIEYREYLETL